MSLNSIIKKGLISVYIPLICIVILCVLIFRAVAENIPITIAFIISIFIGWIWWSYKIVKWKYQAFSKLNVNESHQLYIKAIESGLIWPTGSVFNKTEIWTKKDRLKWSAIDPEIQEIFSDKMNNSNI
ncbi:hypothetical protein [Flavivirga jejuensis]|uniref:PH (Pleckstrin Homology) domain-containing protein n=1 Tax=Flavivirga jejuensis TaxID=870487 RepID=A0ABT8WP09_9FLAO|nr:hypothetical protein [Flavivirga jejuensis]MDO5974896.1 hypothetical protein [Flavivirga jejuensis]